MALQADHQSGSSQGLDGQWVPIEELLALEFFQGTKRALKIKLNANFASRAGDPEPGIKAAVRREYAAGDVICHAGAYGSTAFLLLEGRASAIVPQQTTAVPVPGRTSRSIARVVDMFRRRSRGSQAKDPGRLGVGEVGRYATLASDRPPAETALAPGDFFGIDACINFYPREATVRAEERCVVVEMLRSVLDTIRDAGGAGAKVESSYQHAAIRNHLRSSPLFRELDKAGIEAIAAGAQWIDPDSDLVKDGVLYSEGDAADAVYLVRAGTIKLSRRRQGGDQILSYLGRGSGFGFEQLLGSRPPPPLQLRCVSHPDQFPPVVLQGTVTLGRTENCQVKFPREDTSIGRRHCLFEESQGEVRVVDLESANFTLLNDERVQSAAVKAGDRVAVVQYVFELSRVPDSDASAGAPTPRLATASGLDSFELVQVSAQAMRQMASTNDRFAAGMIEAARSLEAAVREHGDQREIASELVDLNLFNSQNTLLIDMDRCTRCDECVRACADAHDGVARFTRDGPRFGRYMVTMACRSCTDPKCMIGCPVGSIRRKDSLEIHIEDWCIGCERCANQCPFGVINMVERGSGPVVMVARDPQAPAPAAPPVQFQATSCDLCSGYDSPNCVYACPHDAAIRVNPSQFLAGGDRR